jgi:hypothetical protein
LDGTCRVVRSVERQPRFTDVAQTLTGILDEATRDQCPDTCRRRGWQYRQIGLAREDQPQRFRNGVASVQGRACQHLE